ncbi:hypothetical protein ACIOEX_01765 [Streptomyces sp. NPDC087850]|uniref:DUF7848 domain-containing protein n=1 Tax=Streptomyces sp. NPDC087850 TaxID=3365809 RepID=UPI00381D725A
MKVNRSTIRLAKWVIGRDKEEGASPPIREVECTTCMEKSPAETNQIDGDIWALQHTGRNGHTGYREIVTSFLRSRPAEGKPVGGRDQEQGTS